MNYCNLKEKNNIICSILFGSKISTHLFNIWDIPKYMLNFILVDIFFYLGHRLFHIGFLYKIITNIIYNLMNK